MDFGGSGQVFEIRKGLNDLIVKKMPISPATFVECITAMSTALKIELDQI